MIIKVLGSNEFFKYEMQIVNAVRWKKWNILGTDDIFEWDADY